MCVSACDRVCSQHKHALACRIKTSAASAGLSKQPMFDKRPLLVNLRLNDCICVRPHKLQVDTPVCPVSRPHQWSHAILIHHVNVLKEERHLIRKVGEKSKERKRSRAPPDGRINYFRILKPIMNVFFQIAKNHKI